MKNTLAVARFVFDSAWRVVSLRSALAALLLAPLSALHAAEPSGSSAVAPKKDLPLPREVFRVAEHTAFIIHAKADPAAKGICVRYLRPERKSPVPDTSPHRRFGGNILRASCRPTKPARREQEYWVSLVKSL